MAQVTAKREAHKTYGAQYLGDAEKVGTIASGKQADNKSSS